MYHKRRIVYRVIKKKEQMPKPAKGIPLSKAKVHLVLADLVGGISL